MMKRQILAVQDVYVPVQRRQTLDPQKVAALAESIIEKGQLAVTSNGPHAAFSRAFKRVMGHSPGAICADGNSAGC